MAEKNSCKCGSVPLHATGPYRRALWLVAGLNLAMGLIESVAGYSAGSQALKADALDFIGDGLITGLGLLALGWGAIARARTAFLQGIFLAFMGLGVLGNTLYRVVYVQVPASDLMGGIGVLALIVNVACAAILLRHRQGDANVRAVWLFSRNDAIGNAAVVAAAALVALTGSQWPDLVTAAAIAGLFLHAAAAIMRDAREELRRAS